MLRQNIQLKANSMIQKCILFTTLKYLYKYNHYHYYKFKPEFDAPQRKYAVLGILFEISEKNQPFFDAFQLGEKFEESIFNMSKLLGT